MIDLGKESTLNADQVLERAVKFFGESRVGLDLTSQSENLVHFEGGGGSVVVEVKAGGKHTEVDILSVDWDYEAKKFLKKI
jgi:hypothetical protein